MKRSVKFLFGIAAVLVLLLLGFAFVLFRSSTPQPGLLFFGTPTLTSGGQMLFPITNASDALICYWPQPWQVKANGSWSKQEVSPYVIPTRLYPRQAGTIVVTPPAQTESWRFPVVWCYKPDQIETLKVKMKYYLTGSGSFNIVDFTNYSPEITNNVHKQ